MQIIYLQIMQRKIMSKQPIKSVKGKEYTIEEIENSKRILKSATPKGTLDWYLKWIGSVIFIVAVTVRSTEIPELKIVDLILSFIATILWAVVGFLWKDRAVMLINGVACVILLTGLLKHLFM
tara:strand:- start:269 stop:637 length:369 start_codon:yes stop_codon:yes gene_type:complete